MLFQCWASVADSDITLNQQRNKSMCVLCTLNAIPFDKQIYSYLKLQKLSGDFWNLKPVVRGLKLQFRMAAKKLIGKFQSICHSKNSPTKFKMATTKTHKTWPKYYCYLKSHNSCLVIILFYIVNRGYKPTNLTRHGLLWYRLII